VRSPVFPGRLHFAMNGRWLLGGLSCCGSARADQGEVSCAVPAMVAATPDTSDPPALPSLVGAQGSVKATSASPSFSSVIFG
jgi:hypothetical protein